MSFFLRHILFLGILIFSVTLSAEEAEPFLTGERLKEYQDLILNLNTLELEVREQRQELRRNVRLKNAADSKQLEAEYLREMKTIYRKMVEKTSKYNELRTKLKYRFPAKGKLAERRYLPLRAEPLSDFEGETDISRQLSSVRQLVEVQYKPFIKEDKELEMELQQCRQKKVRLRLVQ